MSLSIDDGEASVSTWRRSYSCDSVIPHTHRTGPIVLGPPTLASDGSGQAYFGYAVAATDNIVVVGAYGDDDNGFDSGSVLRRTALVSLSKQADWSPMLIRMILIRAMHKIISAML